MAAKLLRFSSLLQESCHFKGEVLAAISEPEQRRSRPADAVTLLERAGVVATLAKYPRRQVIFSQGSRADTVFYLQRGRVKLGVVSRQGKGSCNRDFARRLFLR